MNDNLGGVLSGRRFALIGFDGAEASTIISALTAMRAFGQTVTGSATIPGLNPFAPFDGCIIDAGRGANDATAPEEAIARIRKPTLLVGSADQMMKHALAVADMRHDFLVRPYETAELMVRAFRIIRNAGTESDLVRPSPRAAARRVLVADDDQAAAILISTVLRHAGFSCEFARDGKSALKLARETLPDLLLLDVGLPQMDGFAVLSALRNDPATSKLPVIVVTGRNNEGDIVKGFSLGADDYITKPFISGEMMARVNRVLRREDSACD
ncbi:MAG TPA: response regulator [Candidatus Binataceae bacterium]|nr:response regulator [Candidatus Binataceae bacterium]